LLLIGEKKSGREIHSNFLVVLSVAWASDRLLKQLRAATEIIKDNQRLLVISEYGKEQRVLGHRIED
jgi:hypothetical protein